MLRRIILLTTLILAASGCSSGNPMNESTTTSIDEAALKAQRLSKAAESILTNDALLPEVEPVEEILRNLGTFGNLMTPAEETDAEEVKLANKMFWLAEHNLCDNLNYRRFINEYKPTRSNMKLFRSDMRSEGTGDGFSVIILSVLDVTAPDTAAPYNSLRDQFALRDGACETNAQTGFAPRSSSLSKRCWELAETALSFDNASWLTYDKFVEAHPRCKRNSEGAGRWISRHERVDSDWTTSGFEIIQRNTTPRGIRGGIIARSIHVMPHADLKVVFVVETWRQTQATAAEYKKATSDNLSTVRAIAQSTMSSWTRRVATTLGLSEEFGPGGSMSGGTTGTVVPPKTPTWDTGSSNPIADLREAPYVQTACDILRKDLPDAVGRTDLVRKSIEALRKLEAKYGLDAKERANDTNLTYQDIWTGVWLIIEYYDEAPTDFRLPMSFTSTQSTCTDLKFTARNTEFSSRNGGW